MVNKQLAQANANQLTPRLLHLQAFQLCKNVVDDISPTPTPDSEKSHHPRCFTNLSALFQSGHMLS
jgi:hypothetical protein